MRLSLFVVVAIGICASTGCLVQRHYNPGPTATYLWVPSVGELPINDPLLPRGQGERTEAAQPES